jgi:acetolactate synthase-1/2/3 large subunit
MAKRTAGRAIVDVLKAEGVRHVFGLPGGHVLSIYDALYDTPEIAHVLVRHEQAAASMASGYAQLTGRPGVCLVTAGPGATNLVSGIAEAFVGSLPIVIFAGRGATATTYRGAAQEIATERVFAPITKWAIRVDRPDLVVAVVHQAFIVARSGKPGPVYIDLPRDVLDTEIEAHTPYIPTGAPPRPAGDDALVASAAAALVAARNPIIVGGGGAIASDAAPQVRALAELLAIPVLTSLSGRGIIPDDHPLSAGGLGAHRTRLSKRLLGEADVVLGLGCRFEEMETNWSPAAVPRADATYIQVDIDPVEIGRSISAHVGIVGDVGTVVGQLLDRLRSHPAALEPGAFAQHPRALAVSSELARIDAEAAVYRESTDRPMHPLRPIAAARRALPRDATVAFDVGCIAQHIAGGSPYCKVYEPRTTIVPSSFYGMGFVAAALPVARIARPNHPALCFVGDGFFQMMLHIMPMAAEHKLGVTWCIMNDGALGSIRDIQQYRFHERIIGTDFALQPDFARIAEACGCYGERVEDPGTVDGAIARALEANERGVPAVLDFAVARERLLGTLEHYAFYPPELVQAQLERATPAEPQTQGENADAS